MVEEIQEHEDLFDDGPMFHNSRILVKTPAVRHSDQRGERYVRQGSNPKGYAISTKKP